VVVVLVVPFPLLNCGISDSLVISSFVGIASEKMQ